MNSFLELVEKRQSVRKFDPIKPVESEKILHCIEVARLAPSACNAQPWKFIVVDDKDLRQKVAAETYGSLMKFNKFVEDAPVILVITVEKANLTSRIGTTLKNIKYPLIDIGIAAAHFCLQAQESGLGTCMIGWFNEKPVQKLLGIPGKRNIGLMIAVGYPVENYKQRIKQRKDINEIFRSNFY